MVRVQVERGAWCDIFLAVGLRDAVLIDRCLYEDPEALDRAVRLLLEAGERPDPAHFPIGRDDVDAVLRDHFAAPRTQN